MKITRSAALFEEAQQLIPGGVNSPVRAFRSVGGQPRFIARAKGSRLYDVDGNTYIDSRYSWFSLCSCASSVKTMVRSPSAEWCTSTAWAARSRRSGSGPVCRDGLVSIWITVLLRYLEWLERLPQRGKPYFLFALLDIRCADERSRAGW